MRRLDRAGWGRYVPAAVAWLRPCGRAEIVVGSAELAILCACVFCAGFVDAIAGGGGLLSLPAYFAVGLPAHAALATNKLSSSAGTATAVARYWRAGTVRIRLGLAAAGGAVVGAAIGARLALAIPAATIQSLILVVVPVVLVLFLLQDRLAPSAGAPPPTAAAVRAALLGSGIGIYDGLFGPGTGTFLAIGFAWACGLDLLGAAANARLANLASNLGALAVFLLRGEVVFPLALWTAAAGICGNALGARLAVRRGARLIRPFMVVVLVALMAEVVRRRFF
jgi:hypothetical protein